MLANATVTGSMFGAMTLSRSNHYGFLKRGMKTYRLILQILRYGIPCINSAGNNPVSATNSAPSKPNSC